MASRTIERGARAGRLPLQTAQDQTALEAQGYCAAKTRGGGWCRKRQGWGTNHAGYGHCRLHGGASPNGAKHARGQAAAAAVEQYGLPRDIDPVDALLEELARTAGHVDWLRCKVGELDEGKLVGPVGQAGQAKDGTTHHPGAEPNAWLALYQAERRHLVAVAGTCAKAGIDERRVRLAERQGQLLAVVLQGVLAELGVADLPQTGAVVRKHLALVGSGTEVTQ